MSARRLAALLVVAAGCAPRATYPGAALKSPAPAFASKQLSAEDDYNAARPEYDALLLDAPDRLERRQALEGYLARQVRAQLERGHSDEALESFKQMLTLYDPLELAGKPRDPLLAETARAVGAAFKRWGAHEPVVLGLAVELALAPEDADARQRYEQVTSWLRAGGVTETDNGQPVDGRGRLISDLENVAEVWSSPFVVAELDRLYHERNQEGASDPEASHRGRRGDLRAFLQGGRRPSTAYDLMRLYLRVSDLPGAIASIKRIKRPQPPDEPVRALLEHYASKEAVSEDALTMGKLLAQGDSDKDVAQRLCIDATRRFPQGVEPHLCAGQIAKMRDQPVVAMREFEAARQLQPGNREIWQLLASLWERRLFGLVSDENLDVSQLEPQLERVQAFHDAAARQFPGKPLRPSMAGALFEVGRGYYNAGRLDKAVAYLERSIAVEQSPEALELIGQIRAKRGDPKAAVELFERAIAVIDKEREEQVYWRARLRRNLGDAYELLGDHGAAERLRRAALGDWDALLGSGLPNEWRSEAGIERAKLHYALGERGHALSDVAAAIDAAPDRPSTYADVLAFLVPRGELDEALDAYHRALGRNEVTEYLKVYCSLWISDLARRAKQPVDPLASAYLQSMDGGRWYDDLARWATGRVNDEVLKSRADTPARRAESAFYRGLRAQEKGDGATAKQLWKEVVDTGMMAFFEYDMAQLYLQLGGAPVQPILKSAGPARPQASK